MFISLPPDNYRVEPFSVAVGVTFPFLLFTIDTLVGILLLHQRDPHTLILFITQWSNSIQLVDIALKDFLVLSDLVHLSSTHTNDLGGWVCIYT